MENYQKKSHFNMIKRNSEAQKVSEIFSIHPLAPHALADRRVRFDCPHGKTQHLIKTLEIRFLT